MAPACEFDKLLTLRVPHVHEKIFFSMDYDSFKNCLEVSKSWNDLLTSESFLKRGKSVFCEDIQKELLQAVKRGNVELIRRVLSSFMVDVNFRTERVLNEAALLVHLRGHIKIINESPLILAAKEGHKDVVQLLLERGAEPNLAHQNGLTPLHCAALQGYKDVVQFLLQKEGLSQT